jgi:hypothetical protein
MNTRYGLIAGLLLALTATINATAEDESPYEEAARYSGTFLFVGGEAERQAQMDSIETVVQQMNRVLRGTARRRMKAGTHITEVFIIDVQVDSITITIDDGRAWTTDLQGTPFESTHDGDQMFMSRRWVEGTIKAKGVQKAGTGTYHFRLSEDGQTLSVAYGLDSKHMPEAVEFDTTYRRVE